MAETATQTVVLPSEVTKYYEENKGRYGQIHVKSIYIGFGGQKLTESGAKLKASQIVAQARGGADFVKLVRAHSDDEASKAKNGDFAVLRITDDVPPEVRDAIFKLKEGEVSDPIRQPNGFYIFRADKVDVRPLPEVRDQIFAELKQAHYGEWVEKSTRDAKVLFNSPAFIGAIQASPPPVDTTPRKQ